MRSRITVIVLACALVLVVGATSTSAATAPRKVPFGFFGTTIDPQVTGALSASQLQGQFGQMARTGVETVRTNLFWSSTEPARGQYDWTADDHLVLAAAQHHISLLPIIEYTPKWASSAPHSKVFANYPPKDEKDFKEFMTQLVHRYGPHGGLWKFFPKLRKYAVRDWQIWNEPEGTYDWAAKPWPSKYLPMLKAGYQAVHAADHGAKVVLAAMVALNLKNLEPWTEANALYGIGARKYFDVMSVNAFTYSQSVSQSVDQSVREVKLVRQVMSRHGDAHKPIWVTEVTWPASLGKIPKKELDGFETTTGGQVARLKAYYSYIATHRGLGIDRAFWYTWATSYKGSQPNGLTPTFAYAGLNSWLPHHRFVARPALGAYRSTAAKYEGCMKSELADVCR